MFSKILTASTVTLTLLSAFLGWRLYDAKAEFAALEKAQAVAVQQAAIDRRATEQKWQQEYDNARDLADKQLDAVNKRYEKALSALAVCNVTYGLPDIGTDTGKAVPGNTPAVDQSQAGGGQCAAANRDKLRDLYRRQLEIARDCDITATHYNELLQLYQSIQN